MRTQEGFEPWTRLAGVVAVVRHPAFGSNPERDVRYNLSDLGGPGLLLVNRCRGYRWSKQLVVARWRMEGVERLPGPHPSDRWTDGPEVLAGFIL